MTDEEKKAIDKLKRSANYFVMPIYETKIILELIEKQSKEIEELKNTETYKLAIIDKDKYISKDKIKEILGIEENIDNDKLLSLLQTIVDENARLEDIEDRKVQIEYNNVFNKGVKSVEDKIKAKIEEYKKLLYSYEKDLEEKLHYVDKGSMNCIIAQIQVLQSLLEKE